MESSDLFSFLLRLWQVLTNRENALRIQLENVLTGEKRGFASLDDLLDYLGMLATEDPKTTGGRQSELQRCGDGLALHAFVALV